VSESGSPPRRGIRSFVRREGRITTAQARALEDLLPVFAIPGEAGTTPADWFGNGNPFCLEIGTGNGENLFLNARGHPANNYLAVEVHRPGIGQLLLQVAAAGLQNVRVSTADIHEVLARLPEGCLQEVCIFFPDPWPKSRHHKRRLLQAPFFAALRRVLASSGRVRIATDIDDYAESILECLANAPGWRNLAGAGRCAPRPRARCLTRFERRALEAGRSIHDFLLARCD
jgi:tRNA (guanine-N7-)-methyltransferase